MQKSRMSMCRVRRVGCWAFVSCLAPRLSTCIPVGCNCSSCSSSNIDLRYSAALPASVMNANSASVDDCAMLDEFGSSCIYGASSIEEDYSSGGSSVFSIGGPCEV